MSKVKVSFDPIIYLKVIKRELEAQGLNKETVSFLVGHPFLVYKDITDKAEKESRTQCPTK